MNRVALQVIIPIYHPDDKFIEALHNNKNIRQALLSLGLVAKGANYKRAKKLLKENPK